MVREEKGGLQGIDEDSFEEYKKRIHVSKLIDLIPNNTHPFLPEPWWKIKEAIEKVEGPPPRPLSDQFIEGIQGGIKTVCEEYLVRTEGK